MQLTIPSLYTIMFLLADLGVQAYGVDSVKIFPASPQTIDTIKMIAYFTTGNSSGKYDQVITITDTSITVSSCYLSSGDVTVNQYQDTAILGRMLAGSYKLKYVFKIAYYYQLDSPQQCHSYPSYDSVYSYFTVRTPSSVNELFSDGQFNIYPNPANKKIEINFKNQQQSLGNMSILNISGQTLRKEQINLNGKSEINIENLP